jgi:hypothetical protein
MSNKQRRFIFLLAPLILYFIISYLYFGRGVLTHLQHRFVSNDGGGADTFIYIWNLHWWSYAFSHHINPFISRMVWAPTGYNLAHSTSTLGLYLLTLPIQWLTTPEVAYNLGAMFTPGLAAWTMFLLGFYLTRKFWPALIAGYFFGFSGYMIGQLSGHYNLTGGVFVLPLILLTCIAYLEERLPPKRFILCLSLEVIFLFLVSIEIFATFATMFSMAILIGLCFMPTLRKKFVPFVINSAIACLIAGIILSPYLYYFFTDTLMQPFGIMTKAFSNDLLSFIIPTQFYLLSTARTIAIASHYLMSATEQNAYLGAPLILLLILFFVRYWSGKVTRYLCLLFVLCALVSLGPNLHTAGYQGTTIFINKWFFGLPFIKHSLPGRYALFTSIIVSLIVAYWLKAGSRPFWRYLLAIIAILFLIPSFQLSRYPRYQNDKTPVFFSTPLYKQWIKPRSTLLILPYGYLGSNTYYQAQTNYYFKLAGGYLGILPKAYASSLTMNLFNGQVKKIPFNAFKEMLHNKNVRDVIVLDKVYTKWRALLQPLHVVPTHVGGVWVYPIQH